jgi:hypothetical protein
LFFAPVDGEKFGHVFAEAQRAEYTDAIGDIKEANPSGKDLGGFLPSLRKVLISLKAASADHRLV